MLDLSDCVEAHLVGIEAIDGCKKFHFLFCSQAKKKFALVAEGVERLLVNEFREQNIVDRVTVRNSTSPLGEYQASLSIMISGESGVQEDKQWALLIEKEVAAIQRGEKVFVSIEPVFGAAIDFLAKKVTIRR